MIHNTIITLNWCFIVISDVKDIIENSALFFLLRSLQISFSIFFAWIVRFKTTGFFASWASVYQYSDYATQCNVCESSTVTSEIFDTLFNCIRLDVSNWWIDRWEFISTLVCATSIMKARKLAFFFWTTSSSTLLSYTNNWTSWFRNMIIIRVSIARASLISLSVLNAVFMNKTRLISKYDFQCSCLKVSMTKQQQQT